MSAHSTVIRELNKRCDQLLDEEEAQFVLQLLDQTAYRKGSKSRILQDNTRRKIEEQKKIAESP